MYLLLLISVALKLWSTVEANITVEESVVGHNKNDVLKGFHGNRLARSVRSVNSSHTLIDQPKVFRIAEIEKKPSHLDPKKHKYKKTPRRTVQKIIKKVRKARKTLNEYTSTTTTEVLYEDLKQEQQQQDEVQTTPAVPKKKTKKWKGKMARYPMPFQKLQPFRRDTVSTHHRIRRDTQTDRQIYILQDLDEITFVSSENGNTAVKAHVKNYW